MLHSILTLLYNKHTISNSFLFALNGSISFKIRFTTCVLCASTLSVRIDKSRNIFRFSILKRIFLCFDLLSFASLLLCYSCAFTFWILFRNIKCLNLLLMLKMLYICRLFSFASFSLPYYYRNWNKYIRSNFSIYLVCCVFVCTTVHTNGWNYQTKKEKRNIAFQQEITSAITQAEKNSWTQACTNKAGIDDDGKQYSCWESAVNEKEGRWRKTSAEGRNSETE